MVYQHNYWNMLARKRKQWCQGITAAPQLGFAHNLSSGTVCDSIFWWICTAGSPHLEGLSHQQQCSSKTREPDLLDGHHKGRRCIASNHAIWNTMLCGAELCVCRPHTADIYTSSSVWNDLTMALPEQQRHLYLQLGVILKFMLEKQVRKLCLNLARLQTKIHHSFQDDSRL